LRFTNDTKAKRHLSTIQFVKRAQNDVKDDVQEYLKCHLNLSEVHAKHSETRKRKTKEEQ